MNIRMRTLATVSLVTLAASMPAAAQQHTVTRVGIVAKPSSYNGPCPANLEFIATIHVSRHPAWVEYQWERSDGGRGPRERIEIRSAGQGVTDRWELGAPGEKRVVWERLHVLAPTGISSPTAKVQVHCKR